mmetsp:Transcript_76936/g.243117  ORF Transcript_76936/g.243117 Transcript_76936/m.243117 type:complete len:206 (+) Transcript_76936:274-891(+)
MPDASVQENRAVRQRGEPHDRPAPGPRKLQVPGPAGFPGVVRVRQQRQPTPAARPAIGRLAEVRVEGVRVHRRILDDDVEAVSVLAKTAAANLDAVQARRGLCQCRSPLEQVQQTGGPNPTGTAYAGGCALEGVCTPTGDGAEGGPCLTSDEGAAMEAPAVCTPGVRAVRDKHGRSAVTARTRSAKHTSHNMCTSRPSPMRVCLD